MVTVAFYKNGLNSSIRPVTGSLLKPKDASCRQVSPKRPKNALDDGNT